MVEDCLLCGIVEGSVPAKKIYEDDDVLAILDFNGANPGHTFVMPKQHIPILEQVPNHLVGKLFTVANKVSSGIFDALKVHGTNLFVANGVSAGQKVAHFMVQIIPRMENDGVNLQWQPKQLSEEEMSTVELKLKDEVASLGFGKDDNVPAVSGGSSGGAPVSVEGGGSPASSGDASSSVAHEEVEGEDNYLLKQIERIP